MANQIQDLSKVNIDVISTLGEVTLIDAPRPVFRYQDGVRTDIIDGVAYTLLSANSWDKYVVKVTSETSPSIEYAGKPISVALVNPSARLWMDYRTHTVNMTITSEGIAPTSKLKINSKGDE